MMIVEAWCGVVDGDADNKPMEEEEEMLRPS
jgi:hypothetical protein